MDWCSLDVGYTPRCIALEQFLGKKYVPSFMFVQTIRVFISGFISSVCKMFILITFLLWEISDIIFIIWNDREHESRTLNNPALSWLGRELRHSQGERWKIHTYTTKSMSGCVLSSHSCTQTHQRTCWYREPNHPPFSSERTAPPESQPPAEEVKVKSCSSTHLIDGN